MNKVKNLHTTYYILLTRKRGFTLIELLVSVTITAFLSSFVIIYTSSGRAQTTLYIEQAKIIQIVARAKSLAISTYDANIPPCGYGVHFDSVAGMYDLFSYSNTAPCGQISSIDPLSSRYTIVRHYVLPRGLMLGDGQNKMSDILFLPPDPKTVMWSGGVILTSGEGSVYLVTSAGPWRTTMHVSIAGQIGF
jgi:prepilin-type N-terminal cleavage/methylation domain-containing protein